MLNNIILMRDCGFMYKATTTILLVIFLFFTSFVVILPLGRDFLL